MYSGGLRRNVGHGSLPRLSNPWIRIPPGGATVATDLLATSNYSPSQADPSVPPYYSIYDLSGQWTKERAKVREVADVATRPRSSRIVDTKRSGEHRGRTANETEVNRRVDDKMVLFLHTASTPMKSQHNGGGVLDVITESDKISKPRRLLTRDINSRFLLS